MGTIKKVLIVDDEIDLGILLREYFKKRDAEVYITQSLQKGLDLMEQINPDIIFIDNNLPDGLGWKMAPRLAEKWNQATYFLISAFHPTAPPMPENVKYHILEKPISFEHLNRLLF